MANARKTAAAALLRVENDSAYSNIAFNEAIKSSELSESDKALAAAIFYGVLDRKITLDYYLSSLIKTSLSKTSPYTLAVLRSAAYQMKFMDKIPPSAAVNEAVKLVKNSKNNRDAGFVNAVLRNLIRTEIPLPEDRAVKSLSVRYSCPEWIVGSFVNDYGTETAEMLLQESLKPPPTVLRVNTLLTDSESLKNELSRLGTECDYGEDRNALILKKGRDISKCELYKNGLYHAEDLASQTAVSVLKPEKGDRVLDICAAPGGKSFTMAEIMENSGEIIACDLYEHRVRLIETGAKRLGINIISAKTADATVYDGNLGKFDCILCDVPCSGLGVLRRKPEIKYKPCEDFTELEEIQLKILKNALKYLKKGGRLLYSTCTLRRDENEKLVNRALMEYNGFRKMYEHTFMPHIDKTDGFYCALIVGE